MIEAQYIDVHPGGDIVRTAEVRDWLMVDVGARGEIVGIEILGDHDSAAVLAAFAQVARL